MQTQDSAHWGGDNKRLMKASWELGVMLHWVLTSVLTFPKICFWKANFGQFLGTNKHIWRKHKVPHGWASPLLFWFVAAISVQTSCDVFSVLYPGLIFGDRPHILNLIFSHSVLLFWSLFFPPHYCDLFNLYASLLVYSVNKWTKQSHSEYTQSFSWLPSFCFGQVEVQPPERDSPPILHMKFSLRVIRSTTQWKKGIISYVAMNGAFQSLKKITHDVISYLRWGLRFYIFNRKPGLQTGLEREGHLKEGTSLYNMTYDIMLIKTVYTCSKQPRADCHRGWRRRHNRLDVRIMELRFIDNVALGCKHEMWQTWCV